MARVFRICAWRLSAISDLARAVYPRFVAYALRLRARLELDLLVRLLQYYLWWFALVSRARDG